VSYTHTTLGDLRTALARRLGDSGLVYWTSAELDLYIKEALQTWGLLTGYWRDAGQIHTVVGQGLYDLSVLQNGSGTELLSRTTTNTTLTHTIQHHLIEVPGGTSEQFPLTAITTALTRRRDMLLAETSVRVDETQLAAPLIANSRHFDVPENVISVERAAWESDDGTLYPLVAEDISSQRSYGPYFLNTSGTPLTYSSSTVLPRRHIIAPPPNVTGNVKMLATLAGADLAALGVSLGIPDDMAWVVKWGAMADVLGAEGPGQDLPRSYFCERRYRMGVELCKVHPVVLNIQVNGVDMSLDGIHNIDRYLPGWQNVTGVPRMVGTMKNYLAVAPTPDDVYSLLIDVVRKAPLPAGSGGQIELGKEYLNNILDYAEHLAAFKSGGEEFRHTYRAADAFFNGALSYNQRLAAMHPALVELIKQSTRDDQIVPLGRRAGHRLLEEAGQIVKRHDE
jgi:hypothetical protein